MAKKQRFAQLELELGTFPGAGLDLPWGGVSPRALTRGASIISFTAEGMGRLDLDASHVGDRKWRSSAQLDLFLTSGGGYG